jgi:hypothetical protein
MQLSTPGEIVVHKKKSRFSFACLVEKFNRNMNNLKQILQQMTLARQKL